MDTDEKPDLQGQGQSAPPCKEETHLNFKHTRLQWERMVLTTPNQSA
jgi:hypothetical protein